MATHSLKTHIHFTDTYTIYPRVHHIHPTSIITNDYSTTPPTPACTLLQNVSQSAHPTMYHSNATRRLAKHEYAYRLPPRFFDDARDGVQVRFEYPIN
jgi:hypothetical protein